MMDKESKSIWSVFTEAEETQRYGRWRANVIEKGAQQRWMRYDLYSIEYNFRDESIAFPDAIQYETEDEDIYVANIDIPDIKANIANKYKKSEEDFVWFIDKFLKEGEEIFVMINYNRLFGGPPGSGRVMRDGFQQIQFLLREYPHEHSSGIVTGIASLGVSDSWLEKYTTTSTSPRVSSNLDRL